MGDVPRRVSWRALLAYVEHLPRQSAAAAEMVGEKSRWSDSEHLLAALVDLTQLHVWMASKDGAKNRNRPKPLRRPGQAPAGRRFGRGRYTAAQLTEIFGW